jgi:hypothetical protein
MGATQRIFFPGPTKISSLYSIINISYLKILRNSEDSQLQAKNTGYSVKN